jgi:hypothetical protein
MGRRFQFRAEDLKAPERPLNEFALSVQERLEALEGKGRELRTFEVLMGSSIGLLPPFPLKLGTDATPKGLNLVRVENLTDSSSLGATPFLQWRGVTGGIELTGAVGFTANTKYRLTVELLYG